MRSFHFAQHCSATVTMVTEWLAQAPINDKGVKGTRSARKPNIKDIIQRTIQGADPGPRKKIWREKIRNGSTTT